MTFNRGARIVILLLALVPAHPARAQEVPAEYQNVLRELGRQGDFRGQTLKVSIPRTDLKVTVKGIETPTPFGFGGWVAMSKGDHGQHVLMGDLVLLEAEVNPVMSAILEGGLDVTALHNHFFWEQPRIFYMHIHGRGDSLALARKLKPALALIGQSPAAHSPARQNATQPSNAKTRIDGERVAKIIGHAGEWSGTVYKITIGRSDFEMRHHGAVIDARMGLNTWAAFVATGEQAAIAGDVAMLEHEVTPVLKALRKHGLDIVAMHHHMTESRPVVIFLHYWGTGPAEKLAEGVRAALDLLGKGSTMGQPAEKHPREHPI